MLLFQLGCLRKYAEICFGKLSKICDMCKIFFTGLFFILWGVDQNSDPVMVFDGNDGKNHTVEGPKLYKRNGYYYIFAPAVGASLEEHLWTL